MKLNLGKRLILFVYWLASLIVLAMLIPAMNIASAAAQVERIDLNIDAITIGVEQKVKTVNPEG